MSLLKKLRLESLRAKSSMAVIVTIALLVEVTSFVQYWFARKTIREEVEHRAETELQVQNLEIQKVMIAVETAVKNTVWTAETRLGLPDSLYSILQHLVTQNATIVGAGMMFVADYYPQKGRWFEPYVASRADGTLEAAQIGGATHDYLQAEFFQNGVQAEGGYWSEPYYDDAGAKMMLCTYTLPVRDANGQIVALMGADVSLDWLSGLINAEPIYPSSINLIFSRSGQLMACPVESLVMQSTMQDFSASLHDTTAQHINRQMMEGASGHGAIVDNNGEKNYVFYAPVHGSTGWSMAIVCRDSEVFKDLRRMNHDLLAVRILGILLLCYIIYRSARSFRALNEANAVKERLSSELHIARGIQESMLPKLPCATVPEAPASGLHPSIDIYASLTPAREVGGDLYDFFIRDEQLFFCIGDVAGKGVPASLVMAVTRSLFRTVVAHQQLPAAIVHDMNESMAEMNESNMFVTLFVGVLDLHTGQLRYCNAGHETPLLVGRGVGLLPTENNIPVGLTSGWYFKGQEAIIHPLTTIFLYTDGLTEAEDATHAQFGKPRMVQVARQTLSPTAVPQTLTPATTVPAASPAGLPPSSSASSPHNLIAVMSEAVHHFVGDAEQSDDLTMLAIRYIQKEEI